MFIPAAKLGRPPRDSREKESPLAFLSQSGAFACARVTTLSGIEPRFTVSIGNQIDLTAGDYLEWLASDPGTEVVACYLEGFRPGDGERWLEAASRVVASGRDVILYRAGRTEAGAGAAASHTASVAGDFTVLRALASQAGVVLADSIADFDDLMRIFTRLRGRRAGALRLGALSNAGFESVAFADSLGPLRLAAFSEATRARLQAILEASRIDGIVAPQNPLDLTPILGDEGCVEAARAVLEDPGVDLGVVGAVPMTPALSDDFPSRLAALRKDTDKPWVAVVDGGPTYDGHRQRLERAGIPTFRSADRAVRLLGVWAAARRRAENTP
jgi:acyl-CoA synthetase (NDP forming)